MYTLFPPQIDAQSSVRPGLVPRKSLVSSYSPEERLRKASKGLAEGLPAHLADPMQLELHIHLGGSLSASHSLDGSTDHDPLRLMKMLL